MLSTTQLNNVLRFVLHARIDDVKALRSETHRRLKRTGAKRDAEKAAKAKDVSPRGDRASLDSIVAWVRRIRRKDWSSIEQLIVVDATATERTTED